MRSSDKFQKNSVWLPLLALLVQMVLTSTRAYCQDTLALEASITGQVVVLDDITFKADLKEDGVTGAVDVQLAMGVAASFSYDGNILSLTANGQVCEGVEVTAGMAFSTDGQSFTLSLADAVKFDLIKLEGDGSAFSVTASLSADANVKLGLEPRTKVRLKTVTDQSFLVRAGNNTPGYQQMVIRSHAPRNSSPRVLYETELKLKPTFKAEATLEFSVEGEVQTAEAYCTDKDLTAPAGGLELTEYSETCIELQTLFDKLQDYRQFDRRLLSQIWDLEQKHLAISLGFEDALYLILRPEPWGEGLNARVLFPEQMEVVYVSKASDETIERAIHGYERGLYPQFSRTTQSVIYSQQRHFPLKKVRVELRSFVDGLRPSFPPGWQFGILVNLEAYSERYGQDLTILKKFVSDLQGDAGPSWPEVAEGCAWVWIGPQFEVKPFFLKN